MRELRKETEILDNIHPYAFRSPIRNERTPKGDGNWIFHINFILSYNSH